MFGQQTNHYHAEGRITNLVRMARFREDQPLIEAFDKYEKATRRRQRSLRSIPDEISAIDHVETLCHVVSPTLLDAAIRQHRRVNLIDTNGQSKIGKAHT